MIVGLLLLLAALAVAATTVITPLSVQPSQIWDGNDGAWSSFGIQIGTPPQSARVLPSNAQNSIWVVLGEGCVPLQDPSDCSQARGLVFQPETSKSWAQIGSYYELIYAPADAVGLSGNAEYAVENVTLGFPGMGPAVGAQMVQGYAAQDPFIGVLGLDSQSINLTSLQNSYPSLLSNLYHNGTIPSLSWGYTAGARYKSPPVFGSLTLGGYDTTRFASNNISVPFGADISRNLLVGIKSIKSNTTDAALLPNGIFATIDSLISTIWLPLSACVAFENAFNLTWDSTTERYLIDDATHDTLLKSNPSITFTLAANLSDGPTVDIVLPYAAFDLQLGLPFVNQTTRYFPLQRAANDTQYIIGRTLLQEAYMITDFHRGSFSIAQALFPSTGVTAGLVAIVPPVGTAPVSLGPRNHTAAIAGGAVAGIVVTAVVLSVAFSAIRRRRRARLVENTHSSKSDIDDGNAETAAKTQTTVQTLVVPDTELDAVEQQRNEMSGSTPLTELESPTDTNMSPSDLTTPHNMQMSSSGTPSPESARSAASIAAQQNEKSDYVLVGNEEVPPEYMAHADPRRGSRIHTLFAELPGEELHPSGRRKFSWEG